jgi:hypothetical protein
MADLPGELQRPGGSEELGRPYGKLVAEMDHMSPARQAEHPAQEGIDLLIKVGVWDINHSGGVQRLLVDDVGDAMAEAYAVKAWQARRVAVKLLESKDAARDIPKGIRSAMPLQAAAGGYPEIVKKRLFP